MKTLSQELISMISSARVAQVATVEYAEDTIKPRIRSFEVWFADETGIYFQTTDLKAHVRQIIENPNIEIHFYIPNQENPMDFKMLRIEGQAEILKGKEWEDKAYTDRPWLHDIGKQMEAVGVKGNLFMFRLSSGEARIFDMTYNCRESQIPVLSF